MQVILPAKWVKTLAVVVFHRKCKLYKHLYLCGLKSGQDKIRMQFRLLN